MSKQLTEDLQKTIQHQLKQFPEGLTAQELHHQFEKDVAKRTLQRWLNQWVKIKILTIVGQGKATKYKTNSEKNLTNKKVKSKEEEIIPLSKKSQELIRSIQQPVQKRKPVGYKREFLDNYKPNVTEYLSKSLRLKLKKMGTSFYSTRPAGTYATQILDRLLVDFSWNSSRLEGNTYSLLDTQRLIQFGETAEGKAAFEAQMIMNHKEAIEFLVHNSEKINFNRYTILNLHALLSNNLLANPAACGQLRKIQVAIGQTVFEPLNIPQLVEECFQQVLETAALIKDPFEQSFFIMVHIPYLQPFEDVNKRVSRLAANISFIKHNLCPLSFIDVPEKIYIDGIIGIYEFNRIEIMRDLFVWAYERSCQRYLAVRQSLGEPDLFRMKYRTQIFECINEIIKNKFHKKDCEHFLDKWLTQYIEKKERIHFKNIIKQELESLHEGNIARFRILPEEFLNWHKEWVTYRG